ncbi:unnamed protein product [Arabis nemorensis]|uniref:Uncharacterized protein n=1 Tax=Arabis nemorensis TaxID=586526 RepID=A0A565CC80_9BRAS|nr:unnamed protein product [Arabis nemorensis]
MVASPPLLSIFEGIQSRTTSEWFWILRTEREYLKDSYMDAALALLRVRHNLHPEWFRSERVCFGECMLTMMWTAKYKEEFLPSSANADGGGKLLPAGSLDYQKEQRSYGVLKLMIYTSHCISKAIIGWHCG